MNANALSGDSLDFNNPPQAQQRPPLPRPTVIHDGLMGTSSGARRIEPGATGQHGMPGSFETLRNHRGTGGPNPVTPGRTLWQTLHDWAAYVLPIFFNKRVIKDPEGKSRETTKSFLDHIDDDLEKAREAYCRELIEIARHRTEAQSQLIRYNELARVRCMIEDVDTKDIGNMQAELNNYAGSNIDTIS